jgi:hypothetical protein
MGAPLQYQVEDVGAPLLRGGGSPYRLGLGPRCRTALCAYGAGRPALRSGAPAGPAWRGAKVCLPFVNHGFRGFVLMFSFVYRHQRRPNSLRIGRLCCPSPASCSDFAIVLPGEFTSGPEAVGQAGTAGAARRSRGASLQRPPWSGVPGGDPPDSEHAEACSHDGS